MLLFHVHLVWIKKNLLMDDAQISTPLLQIYLFKYLKSAIQAQSLSFLVYFQIDLFGGCHLRLLLMNMNCISECSQIFLLRFSISLNIYKIHLKNQEWIPNIHYLLILGQSLNIEILNAQIHGKIWKEQASFFL